MEKLTPAEIDRRMVELYNYRRLYPELREKYEALKKENRQLKTALAQERAERRAEAEQFRIRIEQLEAMVFGSRKKRDHHKDDPPSDSSGPLQKLPRSAASFRRVVPPGDAITDRTRHVLPSCPACGHALEQRRIVTRIVEDIPLPQKMVTEQTIESGLCPRCKRVRSAIPISPQHCTLGQNVRLYVLFAVTVLGQTFEKIRAYLQGFHHLTVSDGELAAIIREGHRKLLPAMKEIETRIRAAPTAHYDETSYPVQHGEQGNYAWVKTSSIGPETVFRLGRTRGKGNAEELRGPPSDQVGMSDDYGGYDHLFRQHALCWAHPLRKFRDLARSGALSPEHHAICINFYEQFHALERSVALTIAAPLSAAQRKETAENVGQQIDTLMVPDASDPSQLATLKSTFLKNREHYLLCIRIPGVPMTNNKAERSLRHLVIKRLLSFGSRSQRGAQAMETILSVLLTLWWSKPKNYFQELRMLIPA